MKKLFITIIMLGMWSTIIAQIDTEQFALDVSKADAANMEKLKSFIWRRHSTAIVKGEEKATVINELSIDDKGKLQVTQLDANTSVQQKRGIRGRIQQNVAEDNMDYVGEALNLAVQYTFMTKGQLLDFFEGGTVTEKDGFVEVSGENVLVQGDKVTFQVDPETKLFINKQFSSVMDGDPVSGEIKYEPFSSGIVHVTETNLNLPGKDAVIKATNQDYTQKVQ